MARARFPIVVKVNRNQIIESPKTEKQATKEEAKVEEKSVEEALTGSLEGEIVEIIAGGSAKMDNSGDDEDDSDSDVSESSTGSAAFRLEDMRAELAAFEENMTPFMRIHMLFTQIGTA